jgi:hypothetical protein
MKRAVLVAFILLTAMSSADARHRHHRWYYSNDSYGTDPVSRSSSDSEGDDRASGKGGQTVASLIPSDWTVDPQKNEWDGKRFVSPDGASWIALYKSVVGKETTADHMKNVVFAPGETITYLRGERTWLAVSGYKDSHVFYRKATLVCGGAAWNHVAMEYPIELKARMDPLVTSLAQAIDNTQADCGATAAKTQ